MNHIHYFNSLFVISVLLCSCQKVNIETYEDNDNNSIPINVVTPDSNNVIHDGSFDNPFSADDLACGSVGLYITSMDASQTDCWLDGYIVGYVNGSSIKNAVFSVGDINTNILLAVSPDINDVSRVVPVQLNSGSTYVATRDSLNLSAHPENLHRRVKVMGKICKYMSVAGVKNTRDFLWADIGD